MTAEERAQLEANADRAMRRGELTTALRLLQQLCDQFPADAALAAKLGHLTQSVIPSELTSAKSRFAPEAPLKNGSPLDEAEVLASRGDYAGAIARYRMALREKPDSELLKERLAELFTLVQAQAPRQAPGPAQQSPQIRLSELLNRISARRKP